MRSLRVAYMGSGTFGIPSLSVMLDLENIEVVAVITQPDRPSGRGKKPQQTPVAEFINERETKVPLHKIENVNVEESLDLLKSLKADLLIVCDFGQILRTPVLQSSKIGCYNIHGSILPKYRGAAPIQRAIINGEERTGVTLIRMVEKCDAGPIVDIYRTPIHPGEIFGSLHERLSRHAAPMLKKFLLSFDSSPLPFETEQVEAEATKAPMIKKGECKLDPEHTAEELANKVRAFSPKPGAYFIWNDKRVKVFGAVPADIAKNEVTGKLGAVSFTEDHGFLTIVCGASTLLEVEYVHLEGSKLLPASVVFNGHPEISGSLFT